MANFAFRPDGEMKSSTKKYIKGKLEVRAKVNTRRGIGDDHIPAGAIGYATRGGTGKMHVYWPTHHEGSQDWGTSIHDSSDLEPTGKRG